MKPICNYYNSYCMCIEYDAVLNAIKITSTNFETNETFVNVQLGNIGDLVKFSKGTIDDYVAQAWGGALPAYDSRIGFIFTKADLEIRKHLITEEDYLDILKKYPKLDVSPALNKTDIHSMRIVFAGTSAALDVTTGKPIIDSKEDIIVDNQITNWYSKFDVEPVDAANILPQNMINMITSVETAPVNYTDPIQRDIWKKYGPTTG